MGTFPPPPYQPERDPAQLQQGAALIEYFTRQVPGQWTADRREQSNHYTGMAYIAIDRRRSEMSSVIACVEKRKRRDRTTFGAGAVSTVKALSPHGGQGNDEDYAPVYDHPLSRLIQYPNGADGPDTFGSLLSHMDLQRGLTGSALVWFVPSKLDEAKPCQMYPLHTALTTPANQGGTALYPDGAWQVTPYYATGTMWAYGGLARRLSYNTILPASEVGALRNEHPLTRSDGYAAFQAAGVWMDILEQIDIARHSHMLQGQQTGTFVYIPGMGQEAADAAAAAYRDKYAGARNARKTAFVSSPPESSGQFKIEQASESARELDFNASHMAVSKLICALFRVPPGICGLDDSDNYAKHYALRQQFHDDLLNDVATYAQFFTRQLCRPWDKRPGDFRIKLQLPRIINKERDEPAIQDIIDVVTVNQLYALKDMPPVRFGDLPKSLYLQKVQELEFPQPIAPPAGPDGAPLPDEEGADEQDPAAAPEDGDQGDDTQDAVTSAALESLGVPADDQQGNEGDETVQKATPYDEAKHKRDHGKFSRAQGSGAKQAIAAHLSRTGGAKPQAKPRTGAHPGGLVNVRDVIGQHGGDSGKAVAAIHSRVAGHIAAGGTVSAWQDGKRQPVTAVSGGALRDAKGAPLGLVALASGTPGSKTGIEFHPVAQSSNQSAQAQPVAPPANPQANHDALAAKLLGGRPNVVLRIAGAAAGDMQHHRITDGASLKRYLAAGGVLPTATYQAAAAKVPVTTPQAQQTVATAHQWAASQADKHADRVAQHFGISRERAHALLVHAIQATAEHAAKNGGKAPTVTIRNKKTGQSATLTPKGKTGPTAGAPPQPKNSAGKGSLPPRGGVAKALPDDEQDDEGDEPIDDVRPELRELLSRLSGG